MGNNPQTKEMSRMRYGPRCWVSSKCRMSVVMLSLAFQ